MHTLTHAHAVFLSSLRPPSLWLYVDLRVYACAYTCALLTALVLAAQPSQSDSLALAVAGEPVITVEGMRAHTTSSLPEQQESMFWACVENFTSAERSRLLKFATGRIRLPVKLVVEAYSGCVTMITYTARNTTRAQLNCTTVCQIR